MGAVGLVQVRWGGVCLYDAGRLASAEGDGGCVRREVALVEGRMCCRMNNNRSGIKKAG